MKRLLSPEGRPGGFTLLETIGVVFLFALTLLGLLSVFDAAARINRSELDVADAQAAVRYGISSMTRAIRMAGSGGLFVTQAVLNAADADLPGVMPPGISYDNVPDGTRVLSLNGPINVRPGTDMIEIRGVIGSPLIGFDRTTGCLPCDPSSGCSPCVGVTSLSAAARTNTGHVNHDAANRPQFSLVDAYTAGATVANPMLVLVAFHDDLHPRCTRASGADFDPLYPQLPYSVGMLSNPTALVAGNSFGVADFTHPIAREFNPETPLEKGSDALALRGIRHAGILDDLIYFIDNTAPLHPALALGTRRGAAFDVVALADDVEDMQIAYGVDSDGDNAIRRKPGKSPSMDSNVSSEADGDEWAPNLPDEAPFQATDFQSQQPPPSPVIFLHPGEHCPRLHAVMICLVARSHDPDPGYRAPSGLGVVTMNSPTTVFPNPRSFPGGSPGRFRRRVQTLRIHLRNYAYGDL